MLAFKTGVSVAADLYLGGFDTHARNDAGQGWLLAIIYSKHVHKAQRRYPGVENSAGVGRYPFSNTEDFRFFG